MDANPKPMDLPAITDETIRTWTRIRHNYSAGGVAYRRLPPIPPSPHTPGAPASIEIALIATRGGQRWQLPKGSREANESSLQTAIREVAEEVGLATAHEEYLKTIDYWYWDTYRKEVPELVHKTVDFFLLRVTGGVLSDACYEVDAVGWFTLDEADALLTFGGEQEVVHLARQRLASEG